MEIALQIIRSILLVFIWIGDFAILTFTKISYPFYLAGKKSNSTIRKTKLFKRRQYKIKVPPRPFLKNSLDFLRRAIIWLKQFLEKIYGALLLKKDRLFIKSFIKRKKKEIEKVNKARPSFAYKLKFIFFGAVISFVFVFIPLLALIFLADLPSLSRLSMNYIPKTTKIYDRNGTLLYEIYANENRTIVSLEDVPEDLKNATIAIEDKDFYNHPGFDIKAIVRAFFVNITNRGFEGGSTITQQLIKLAFLTPDPNISRKIKEVALAFWAEQIYTKDQILELYLNYAPYGGSAWGIQAASEIYFNKEVSDLTLAESTFLAGLPRAPSIYSPYFGDGKLWKQRQKEVLNAMTRDSYITKQEADLAYNTQLEFQTLSDPIKAPHFVMYVRDLLIKKYGLSEVERGGLQVFTSLDLELQEKVQEIVRQEVDSNSYLNIGNGAALVTNPQTGEILAMVGSRDYFDRENDGNVNITTALRQPGSTIKIVTYSLALSQGFTEATILNDSPLTIRNEGEPPYSPVNYDGRFHGNVTLRRAFANSFNIPAVRTAQKLGVSNIVELGKKMGISSWSSSNNYGLSITLGGADVTMLDLVTVFGTVANEGTRVDTNPILEIKDSYGQTIHKKSVQEQKVIDPAVAFIISDILADNEARSTEFGINTPLNIPGERVSVKTGTTDNKRDNWTIGYTPYYVVATWVGNNDNSPMNQALASGISGAAPMWNRIMDMVLEEVDETQDLAVTIPPGIIKKFCLGEQRYFIEGTESSVNCFPRPSISPTPAQQ